MSWQEESLTRVDLSRGMHPRKVSGWLQATDWLPFDAVADNCKFPSRIPNSFKIDSLRAAERMDEVPVTLNSLKIEPSVSPSPVFGYVTRLPGGKKHF